MVEIDTPTKRLNDLRKEVRQYEEYVNKCDISNTNYLAQSIRSNIDFLKFSSITTTEEQRQELKRTQNEFDIHMTRLKKCRCIKKLKK